MIYKLYFLLFWTSVGLELCDVTSGKTNLTVKLDAIRGENNNIEEHNT